MKFYKGFVIFTYSASNFVGKAFLNSATQGIASLLYLFYC